MRGNKAHCPWHADKTPSLSFYNGNRRFHCFSCGEGGDAVDLTQKLLNLSTPLEALQQLNADYHLGLQLNRPVSDKAVQRAIRERERRKNEQALYRAWVMSSHRLLAEYFRLLRGWRRTLAPPSSRRTAGSPVCGISASAGSAGIYPGHHLYRGNSRGEKAVHPRQRTVDSFH